MNNAKVLKKWILFPILVAFVAILNIDNVTAQQAGSAQNTATIQRVLGRCALFSWKNRTQPILYCNKRAVTSLPLGFTHLW